jgi:very-short-patch-repair endonuclease
MNKGWFCFCRFHATKSFGFVTTKSITQVFNRRVIQALLESSENKEYGKIYLSFAVPNHPWVDSADSDDYAAVRIAMTSCSKDSVLGRLETVVSEIMDRENGELLIRTDRKIGLIQADLSIGPNVLGATVLNANSKLAGMGVMLGNRGFLVDQDSRINSPHSILRKVINGNDVMKKSRNLRVIDFYQMSLREACDIAPEAYQQVLERVKPQRDLNNRKSRKENWWIFGEVMPKTRQSIEGLNRYIVTSETCEYRVFVMIDSHILPEHKLVVIGSSDAYHLGILSSQTHVNWAIVAGGRRGVGNTPVYSKTKCFDPFPFPDPTPEQKQKIRELGDRLDSHRKQVQAAHPEITITGMYNLLEKLRAGQPFTDGDREYNNKALVSTLKQIHDELDVAVLEAYGWQDLVPMLSPSPLAPLPAGEGNRIMPPSPLGRRAGDEGKIGEDNPVRLDSSRTLSPSPLAPLPAGEGNRKDINPSDWDSEFSQLAGRWRQIPDAFLQQVRQLRQQQTPAEKFLWELLRDRRFLDAKFRRQHTLGSYIADFYCHQAHLVIELDGDIHQNQTLRDQDRDQWMQANGLTVLRFPNDAVYQKTAEVLNAIAETICPSPLAPLPEVEENRIMLPSPLGRRAGDEGKSLDETILERLVALNAERAAEERNGLIRWLRPEYQTPDQVKPTQTTLEGIGVEEETAIIAPVEPQKWPNQPKAQLAAIRDLLRTSSGEWTDLQIASQFTGRNTQKKLDAVRENCDRLEWFGLLIQREEAGIAYWQYAELQQTA